MTTMLSAPHAPIDDIHVPFVYSPDKLPLECAGLHTTRDSEMAPAYSRFDPMMDHFAPHGAMHNGAASDASRYRDLPATEYPYLFSPVHFRHSLTGQRGAYGTHGACGPAPCGWVQQQRVHAAELDRQEPAVDFNQSLMHEVDIPERCKRTQSLTTPPPSATSSPHGEAPRSSKSSKKDSAAKQAAAKPHKQCAYECCPSPLHSNKVNPQHSSLNPKPLTLNPEPCTLNPSTLKPQHSTLNPQPSIKWRVVTPDTTAGGRDWTSLMGKTLCDSCYSTFRKHGTFIRSVRTPEGWTRFDLSADASDYTATAASASYKAPGASAKRQRAGASDRPEAEGLAKRAARSNNVPERAASPSDELAEGRPSRSRKPSMRLQASILTMADYPASSPKMRSRRGEATHEDMPALAEEEAHVASYQPGHVASYQPAHVPSYQPYRPLPPPAGEQASYVGVDAPFRTHPDAPFQDDVGLSLFVPLTSTGCEVDEEEDLLSEEEFSGSLDDFLLHDSEDSAHVGAIDDCNDGSSFQESSSCPDTPPGAPLVHTLLPDYELV